MHALITPDGELAFRPDCPTVAQVRALLGGDPHPVPTGSNRIVGWTRAEPDPMPRNVIGSLVLAGCGAKLRPYGGPVVVTGWEAHGPFAGLRTLTPATIPALRFVYHDALMVASYGLPLPGETAQWGEMMHAYAGFVAVGNAFAVFSHADYEQHQAWTP